MKKESGNWKRFWIFLICFTIILICINLKYKFIYNSHEIFYAFVLLIILSRILSLNICYNYSRYLKYSLIWAIIFLSCLIAYSYKTELSNIKNRVLANVIPQHGIQKSKASMSFQIASDGHFYIQAILNKETPVTFLVDTGASHIILSKQAAVSAGFDILNLYYDKIYSTANGKVRGSSIIINDFNLGKLYLKNVKASINEAPMRNSLLGMSFFKRLKAYHVNNDILTLFW